MKLRLESNSICDSIVDGPGLRMVIWTQGCIHNCYKCNNLQTHKLNDGIIVDTDSIIYEMKKLKLHRGITLSGVEPFLQVEVLSLVGKEAQKRNINLKFRGSFNQRIIDVKRSLIQNEVVLKFDYIEMDFTYG